MLPVNYYQQLDSLQDDKKKIELVQRGALLREKRNRVQPYRHPLKSQWMKGSDHHQRPRPVAESIYYLNNSRSKFISVSLNADDNFKTTITLGNPAHPHMAASFSVEEWENFWDNQYNISTYLTAHRGEEEMQVGETQSFKVYVTLMFEEPTVILASKAEPDRTTAIQIKTWRNLQVCMKVITLATGLPDAITYDP